MESRARRSLVGVSDSTPSGTSANGFKRGRKRLSLRLHWAADLIRDFLSTAKWCGIIYGGLIYVFLKGLLKREDRTIKQATRNHLVPRAEIERKVAQFMNANHEATDEEVGCHALIAGQLERLRLTNAGTTADLENSNKTRWSTGSGKRPAFASVLGDKVPWRPVTDPQEQSPNETLSGGPETIRCCDNPSGVISKSKSYPYARLPCVVLVGASVYRCENCKTEIALIPSQSKLEEELATLVLLKAASLSGRELRFLRKAGGLTIEQFAEVLGVSRITLMTWEACPALRYKNDLTARIVIAARLGATRLIPSILQSIRIGHQEMSPLRALWSDAEARWVIEPLVR